MLRCGSQDNGAVGMRSHVWACIYLDLSLFVFFYLFCRTSLVDLNPVVQDRRKRAMSGRFQTMLGAPRLQCYAGALTTSIGYS